MQSILWFVTTSVSENIFLEIFKDNWIPFKQKFPGYATAYYDDVIKKVINCGDPNFGYSKYQCLHCGLSDKIVGFSCKSTFCLKCSRLVTADFVEEVQRKLHSGVVYRHLVLTIPSELRPLFHSNRQDPELFNLFFQSGKACIEDLIRTVRRNKAIKCGMLSVIHTVGRKADYKPHLHMLVMDGGIDETTGLWVKLGKFPYEILHKKWQYHLLEMIKLYDPSQKKNVNQLWEKFKKGFVAEISEGQVPHRMKQLTKYLSKYLFRPAISLRRILKYDIVKKTVTYEYNSHETKKKEIETVDVLTFIGRMVQQILPKGFQRVRYYGLQSTASYKKAKEKIMLAMQACDDGNSDSGAFIANTDNQNYADKVKLLTGKDPLICTCCGKKMCLVKVWQKDRGIIFDYFRTLEEALQTRGPPLIQKLSQQEVNVKVPRQMSLFDLMGCALS